MSKMIIEAEGIKREVPLPAALCVSREVAYQIRDAMNQFIGSEAVYGWVTVHRETVDGAGANTKPLPWRETVVAQKVGCKNFEMRDGRMFCRNCGFHHDEH